MTDLNEEFKEKHFRVGIFGSARINEESPTLKLVSTLARLIADAGLDLDLLYVTRNCDEAFTVITHAFEQYQKGETEFCRTYHRYKLT